MSYRRFLVAYTTSYGQTAKIASRIADLLVEWDVAVTAVDIAKEPLDLEPHAFDGIILGASIIAGRHQPAFTRFVRAHRDALNTTPSAFFSVSGSAASRLEAERARARAFVDEFLAETGWHPTLTATVGGAMAYTRYNWFLRWVTRRAAKAAGGPTDTSRDHEVTDWAQVESFALAFEQSVQPAEPSIPSA
jgi:menaquinone-dependent protoporphyrinogen oxidase